MKSATLIDKANIWNLISSLFGVVAFGIGVINTFWGNDPGFGIFIILLSLLFFPPINSFIKARIGFAIPGVVKFFLAAFILWASLGVGELFHKIDMMLMAWN